MRLGLGMGLDAASRPGAPGEAVTPEAPEGLSVQQVDGELMLTWDDAEWVTWSVYRSAEIDDFESAVLMVSGLSEPTWMDVSEAAEEPWCYWVTAVSRGLESEPSDAALGQLLVPQGEASLTADVEPEGMNAWLDWSAGEVGLVTSWMLYAKAPSAGSFTQQGGLTERSMTFAVAEEGVWQFYIRPVNAVGLGEASNIVTVSLPGESSDTSWYRRPASGFRYLRPDGASFYLRP